MNPSNPQHKRRSIRLKGYDYSRPGAYFVTLVTWHREKIFGEVIDGEMFLNKIGLIVHDEWMNIESIRKEISLDEYILMPNHLHAIVWIEEVDRDIHPVVGAHGRAPLHRTGRESQAVGEGLKPSPTQASGSTVSSARAQSPGDVIQWQRHRRSHPSAHRTAG